jgi:hypothetical protein
MNLVALAIDIGTATKCCILSCKNRAALSSIRKKPNKSKSENAPNIIQMGILSVKLSNLSVK